VSSTIGLVEVNLSLCYADRRRCHRLHHLSSSFSSLTSKSTGINGCGVFRAKLLCNVHKICDIVKRALTLILIFQLEDVLKYTGYGGRINHLVTHDESSYTHAHQPAPCTNLHQHQPPTQRTHSGIKNFHGEASRLVLAIPLKTTLQNRQQP
jgi:hypothetical protein